MKSDQMAQWEQNRLGQNWDIAQSSNLAYLLAGIGIGTALGILLAPRSGRETREYLRQRTEEGRERLTQQARDLRGRAGDMMEKGKEFVQQARDQVAGTAQSGSQTYTGPEKL